MNKEIDYYINEYYRKKNYDLFKKKCSSMLIDIEKLSSIINQVTDKFIISNLNDNPSIDVNIYYKDFRLNDFCVHYDSVLTISKISNLYYIYHSFDVENKDPEGFYDTLMGDVYPDPYTKSQSKLDEDIENYLNSKGLKRINLSDLDEVVPEFEIEQPNLFDTQMTVETLLFRDIYGICDEE